ncbi:MAG: SDR family oxidoreductase [Bacteroidota bacterium]|nr:SDR family oxidoreductase [Bacteroidota bacterium]
MNIADAKVLITGGSSGIGFETAKRLQKSGAQVVISSRNELKLKEAAKILNVIPIVADISSEKDVISLMQSAYAKLNGLNVVINNAAYGYFDALVDINLDKFQKMLATNLTGSMLVGREAAKIFIKQNYGNIINISSTAGLAGFANGSAYVASKFALKGMTECWRTELRKHNIRIMLVNPSEVQTNFIANSGREPREINPTKLEATEIAHLILSMLEMRDLGFITEATVFATNPS